MRVLVRVRRCVMRIRKTARSRSGLWPRRSPNGADRRGKSDVAVGRRDRESERHCLLDIIFPRDPPFFLGISRWRGSDLTSGKHA